MPKQNVTDRMRAYRNRLRAEGLKPVQVWVHDVKSPAFKRNLRTQVAGLDAVDESAALDFIETVADLPADDYGA